jgi:hypothetical protein
VSRNSSRVFAPKRHSPHISQLFAYFGLRRHGGSTIQTTTQADVAPSHLYTAATAPMRYPGPCLSTYPRRLSLFAARNLPNERHHVINVIVCHLAVDNPRVGEQADTQISSRCLTRSTPSNYYQTLHASTAATLHKTIIAHDNYDGQWMLLMQVSNSTGEVCRAYENLGFLTTEFEFC